MRNRIAGCSYIKQQGVGLTALCRFIDTYVEYIFPFSTKYVPAPQLKLAIQQVMIVLERLQSSCRVTLELLTGRMHAEQTYFVSILYG